MTSKKQISYDTSEYYRFIIDTFINIVEHHAPLKKKVCWRKSNPFNKEGTEKGDIY